MSRSALCGLVWFHGDANTILSGLAERMLGLHECPAAFVKLRMEQAGYDFEDGIHLLGAESLSTLLKFVYKSQLLAGVRSFTWNSHSVN